MTSHNKKLVEQSEALDSFFESLMHDVEAYAEHEATESSDPNAFRKTGKRVYQEKPVTTPVAQAVPESISDTQLVSDSVLPVAKALYETLPPVLPEAPAVQPEVEEPETTPATESESQYVIQPEPQLGRPAWGEREFQAMLFKVAGLTLAVPLVDLNGVVECDVDKATAMPGHADFYLGLMTHLGRSVPLVDTARFVLPPNKLHLLAGNEAKDRITRAVMIHDCGYALACDEVNEVLTLHPDAVRWRTQRTTRRWLAGTVIEHMCALIDATAFAELLAQGTSIQAFRE